MTTKPPDVNGAKKTMINTSNNDEYKSKRVDHRKGKLMIITQGELDFVMFT